MSDGGNDHFKMADLLRRQAEALAQDAAELLSYRRFMSPAGEAALSGRVDTMVGWAAELAEGAVSAAMAA